MPPVQFDGLLTELWFVLDPVKGIITVEALYPDIRGGNTRSLVLGNHPWPRGSNESTNRLLRQYLPRGIDMSTYSQAKLGAVARQLNERSRKNLAIRRKGTDIFPMSCRDPVNPHPNDADWVDILRTWWIADRKLEDQVLITEDGLRT